LDRYVEAVKDKALLRRIATIAASLEKRALSGVETGEQLRESLGKLTADLVEAAPSERRPVSTAEMITQVGIDELLRPKRVEGVRLPWGRLDTKLRGLRGGQNVVLAADTGRGKTSMALQIAAHATRQGKAVLYWTLEMPPAALFRRMVTQMSGVDVRNASPTFEQREKERAAVAWLHDSPVYFDRHSRTVAGFCSSVRQIRQKTCLGLVVVDYLQLIRASGRSESRTREVGENSRSLKLATMDFDLPFLVLSQFRRPNGESQPTIHSLKESGDVENDADVILLLNCGELSAEAPTQVAVHVGKQREGPAGFDVPLVFHPRLQSFHSPEEARTCNVPGDTQ
ncbi:MAG TPA: DnaB-like helicase C-terminal domain-containing protein, partial [Candidatus Acidoferrales bacterium]|nr:DnaB-like helicase C-terminal domain-containing protein [Candidatus Acidoferrales bacterium]